MYKPEIITQIASGLIYLTLTPDNLLGGFLVSVSSKRIHVTLSPLFLLKSSDIRRKKKLKPCNMI